MTHSTYIEVEFLTLDCANCVELEVEYDFSPGRPAQIYGPPERCYPAEGPEVEIGDIYITEETFKLGENGERKEVKLQVEVPSPFFSEEILEALCEHIIENHDSSGYQD